MENPKEAVLQSVRLLPEQIQSAWDAVQILPLPEQFHEAEKIVITGMGGSALGGRILHHYARPHMPIPVEVITHYELPEYVDEKTLVIVSSYSGNTEETISALEQALEKNAMIFVITTGGKLEEKAVAEGLPSYIFEPEHNPSRQPRMATGYSIGAIFSLLNTLNLLHLPDNEMMAAISVMRDYLNQFASEENIARDLSEKIQGKMPVLVSSEHLIGATHVFKNQLNESSKSFSVSFELPELNHHLMEGLVNPYSDKQLIFILFESDLYHERVQKRYPLTAEVIEKNNIETFTYKLKSDNRLQQIFELIALGSYVEMYLAELYGSDPVAIPWVDYFKEKLASN
jgi:glucose/mannose-6-phosphate isomerase